MTQVAPPVATAAAEPAVPTPPASRPAPELTPSGREPWVVAGTTVIILVVGLWRITAGASLSDDAHVIALAVRLARGDVPFADEMNAQVLGSIWAVPFTWVWLHAVGTTGLVIASRVVYLAFALGVGVLAYRALRVSFRAVVAATAVAVPLLAPPYNLLDLSYNTAPIALGALAVGAAHAALATPATRSGRRWAVVAGVATAATVLSNPLVLPGGVVLTVLVLVLARRRAVIVPFLLGAAGVTGLALVALARVGFAAVAATLDYASTYRDNSYTLPERLAEHVRGYVLFAWRPALAPAAVAALVACVPRLPRRLRALALVAAAAGAVVPSFVTHDATGPLARVGTRPGIGTLPAVTVVLLALTLLLPVLVWAVARRRGDVGTLLALGVPPGLVSVPLVAAGTLSAPTWGAAAVGAAPAVTVVVAGWAVLATLAWRPLGLAACGALVAAVLALLVLTPFRDQPPWRLDVRISSGAYAGVRTSRVTADAIAQVTAVTSRWLRPGDGVLFYGMPGGYVLVDAPADTNILWLTNYGAANRSTLEWFRRTGRVPRVVVIDQGLVVRSTDLARLGRSDPLIAFVLRDYRVVDAGPGRPTVLVRTSST